MRPIPFGQRIVLAQAGAARGLHAEDGNLSIAAPTPFTVLDRGLARVALGSAGRSLTIAAEGRARLAPASGQDTSQSFQWIETPTGDLVLMSLATHRFLRLDLATGTVRADSPGPSADAGDGVHLTWSAAQ